MVNVTIREAIFVYSEKLLIVNRFNFLQMDCAALKGFLLSNDIEETIADRFEGKFLSMFNNL